MKSKLIFLALNFIIPNLVFSASPLSSFSKTESELAINSVNLYTIITKTFTLLSPQKVLAVANGRYYPYYNNGIAQVLITIDGNGSYSNY